MPREDWEPKVRQAATEAGLDPNFVARLVQVESDWNPSLVSKKGAIGLMQVLPSTAKDYGVTNLRDPKENIKAGIAHLKRLSSKYHSPELLAAAYNAGEGAVEKHGGVPPFKETQTYVEKVDPFAKWATKEEAIPKGEADPFAKWVSKEEVETPQAGSIPSNAPPWAAAIIGAKQGIEGGLRGYGRGLLEAPGALVSGVKTMLTQNPLTTARQAVEGVAAIPGAVMRAGQNPEEWGAQVGNVAGQTMLTAAAPKVPAIARQIPAAATKAVTGALEIAEHPVGGAAIGAGLGYAHGGLLGAAEGAIGGGAAGRLIRIVRELRKVPEVEAATTPKTAPAPVAQPAPVPVPAQVPVPAAGPPTSMPVQPAPRPLPEAPVVAPTAAQASPPPPVEAPPIATPEVPPTPTSAPLRRNAQQWRDDMNLVMRFRPGPNASQQAMAEWRKLQVDTAQSAPNVTVLKEWQAAQAAKPIGTPDTPAEPSTPFKPPPAAETAPPKATAKSPWLQVSKAMQATDTPLTATEMPKAVARVAKGEAAADVVADVLKQRAGSSVQARSFSPAEEASQVTVWQKQAKKYHLTAEETRQGEPFVRQGANVQDLVEATLRNRQAVAP